VAARYVPSGALIHRVEPGSAADRAGIVGTRTDVFGRAIPGDVIIAIDDHPVKDSSDLHRALDGHRVDDEVIVTLRRQDADRQVKVRLQALQ